MKKQFLLLAVFCASFTFSYSQSAQLILHNPLQRVGDKISVSFKIDPTFEKEDPNTNVKPEPLTCRTVDNSIASGHVSIAKQLDSEGVYEVGPFSLNIEGKNYESNSLKFNVYPKLPEVTNGVWVSYITYANKNYIIVEQREERKQGYDPYSRGIDTWIKMDKDIFNTEDKEIVRTSKSGKSGKIGDVRYSENIYIFQLWLSSDYDNSFILTKEHLLNLPEDANFEPILICKPLKE